MTDSADGRALAERLRAERDERRRLAELIHDGPVQLVAAITQMLDAAHHALADGDVASGAADRRTSARGRPRGERRPPRDRQRDRARRPPRSSGSPPRSPSSPSVIAARRGVAFELQLAAGDALGEGAQSGLYQIMRDALDQAVRRGPPARVTSRSAPRTAASS